MPLTPCPDCGKDVSSEAPACPHCGRPNKQAAARAKDGRQHVGCAVIAAGIATLIFINPGLGAVLIVAGLIYAALNTRFK